MRSLYKNAELTIFASFCGPTNIPPLEALATGSPLICSKSYSMPNQVKKGAILFNPNSPKDLYKKMLYLSKNKKLKRTISREGKKIIKNYNQSHFNKLLNNYINKLIN